MATFEERLYELGSQALGEQERQVAEIRGRGSTLVAGAAVVASLLARPVFHGGHPDGFTEWTATAVGLAGAGCVLLAVVLLLRPYELGFSVSVSATHHALWDQGLDEQPEVDVALANAFEDRRTANGTVVRRLVAALSIALVALVLETAGLAAAAALAS